MLLIGVPLFALAAGCGMYMLTGQIWLGILVGMLFLSIFGRWLALGVSEQLRFRVVLNPDFVRLGGGIFRLDLPYEEIDEVHVMNDRTNGKGIGFVSCGRTASVRLKLEDAIRCFEALQDRCPNAVFVDSCGNELVNIDHDQPDRTALVVERYSRRKGVHCVGAAIALICSALFQIAVTVQTIRGKNPELETSIPKMIIYSVALIAGAIGAITVARASFSRAERAKMERLHMLSEEDPS